MQYIGWRTGVSWSDHCINQPVKDAPHRDCLHLVLVPIIILTLLLLWIAILDNAEGSKSGDIYVGPGNWDINNPTVYRNESETITGDIIIHAGGSLIFDNGTLAVSTAGALFESTTGDVTFINTILYAGDDMEDDHAIDVTLLDCNVAFIFCELYNFTDQMKCYATDSDVTFASTYIHHGSVRVNYADTATFFNSTISNCSNTIALHFYQVRSAFVNYSTFANESEEWVGYWWGEYVRGVYSSFTNLSVENSTFLYIKQSIVYRHNRYKPYAPFTTTFNCHNNTHVGIYRAVIEFRSNAPLNSSQTFSIVNQTWENCDSTHVHTYHSSTAHYNILDPIGFESIAEFTNTYSVKCFTWVIVKDAFLDPVQSARFAVINSQGTTVSDDFTNISGYGWFDWLTIEDQNGQYNPMKFVASKHGAVEVLDAEITRSQSHLVYMIEYEQKIEVAILLINNFSKEAIPFGDLLCYLNDDGNQSLDNLVFGWENSVQFVDYAHITVYDHFNRLVYEANETAAWNDERLEILCYIDYVWILIIQRDVSTWEPGVWVYEWNLTLTGGTNYYLFEGDAVGVPVVEDGNNNYTLTWGAGFNYTAGSSDIEDVAAQLPPSSHSGQSSGYMVHDVGITMSVGVVSKRGDEGLLAWLDDMSQTREFRVFAAFLAVAAGFSLFFTMFRWNKEMGKFTRRPKKNKRRR